MIFWGIGMGAQESILKAAVADLIPVNRRGTAFGLFNTVFGLFWFAGSAVMGFLYDRSVNALIIFSITAQAIAIILLAFVSAKKSTPYPEGAMSD